MGSLNASGIPVAEKDTNTYRKQDIRITSTDNTTDVITVITENRPGLNRTIGSGSIVRDDNINPATVEYHEEIAWGLQFESRSTSARLARDGARDLSVPDVAVPIIPTGLVPNTPQEWAYHQGETIVRKDSVDDSIIDRVPGSGAFD
jgi:hypothetical protein